MNRVFLRLVFNLLYEFREAPFDPLHPEQPIPMVEGLPDITMAELEVARRTRREHGEEP